MPTCSQAKIITNLETDIQKRLFALTRAGGGGGSLSGIPGGGGDGITQYQANGSSAENSVNDENFYDAVQNLNNNNNNHHQQHQQTNHQSNVNSNIINDSNDINKISSQTTSLNINENFKLYQSFHRPTKTLSNNIVLNPIHSSANNINTNTNQNSNIANAAVNVNNSNVKKLGTLKIVNKQQTAPINDNTKSIYNQNQEMIYPNLTQQQANTSNKLAKKSRRISIDELPTSTANEQQVVHKIPIIFGDFHNQSKKEPSLSSSTAATYGGITGGQLASSVHNQAYNNSLNANNAYKNGFSANTTGLGGLILNKNYSLSNQVKINTLRTSLNLKNNVGSDGEDLTDEQLSGRSGDIADDYDDQNQSHHSSSPRSETNKQYQAGILNNRHIQNQLQQQQLLPRKSIDYTSILPLAKSKRNSIDFDSTKTDRRNSIGHCSLGAGVSIVAPSSTGYFTTFPKIAVQVDSQNANSNHIDQDNDQDMHDHAHIDGDDIDLLNERRISINQAKRLLALASIRPSKTFHKSMTQEEIEVLRKYYDIIKPKVNNAQQTANQLREQSELDNKNPYANEPPIVYDTTKVNLLSLHNLKSFIETYKKDIDSGMYVIDYDSISDPKGFVLKNQQDPLASPIKFPNEINDTFFALAVTSSSAASSVGSASLSSIDKENSQRLGEANLFRIVNWNDTPVITHQTKINKKNSDVSSFPLSESTTNSPSKARKMSISSNLANNVAQSLTGLDAKSLFSSAYNMSSSSSSSSNSVISPTSSTLSFEYIKSLSSLVNSILEPKLLNKLSHTGVDISVLPGGANYDIPSFEELGIDLNNILSGNSNATNVNLNPDQANQQQQILYQNSKLKASAYKKLKDKVNTTKCMWFSSPPERKPLSVIFESTGISADIGHEQLLDETNNYLKEIGGHVESLEFVPRSVHFGSVYVENLWILTLNDMNTKFFTITNGLKIKDEKLTVKSYDEFIFSEYERFIRNEKYKKLIKNHEKAVQQLNNAKQANSNVPKKVSKKSTAS